MSKRRRQKVLIKLIKEKSVETQEKLRVLLKKDGFDATQATLSRDLKELGVFKVRNKRGRLIYSAGMEDKLSNKKIKDLVFTMQASVEEIKQSDNLLVIKTTPGNAQGVAAALDQIGQPGVLGSVAGDDTILVITENNRRGRKVKDELDEILLKETKRVSTG